MSAAILVVEDDENLRVGLVDNLEDAGYRVTAAASGAEALAAWRQGALDLVVLDVMLPDTDGYRLCATRRAAGDAVPVLMLTARSLEEDVVRGLDAGADDYLAKPLDRDELHLRLIAAQRVTTLHRKLQEQARELERLNREFFESGRVDALTGIANRLRMQEDLRAVAARIERFGDGFSIALFDIDHFKLYNDTLGHVAGDEVLREVARALAGACRSGDTVYRYGGEEFLAILGTPNVELAAIIVDRMRLAVEECGLVHPKSSTAPVVTVSAGVASLLTGGTGTVDDALRRADMALFRAKQQGRNRLVVHDDVDGDAFAVE